MVLVQLSHKEYKESRLEPGFLVKSQLKQEQTGVFTVPFHAFIPYILKSYRFPLQNLKITMRFNGIHHSLDSLNAMSL